MTQPGPASVRTERGAVAMFTFPDGDDTFPFVAAFVYGYAYDGGQEDLYGVLVKGKCERERRKNGAVSIGCGGRGGVGGPLRNGEFQMDPALQNASLTLRGEGAVHKVRWTAQKTPGMYRSSEWCSSPGEEEPEGQGHGAGLFQRAIATGNAFGRKLESSGRWFDIAQIEEGAMVTQCSWLSPRDLDALREGRYEDVRFRLAR